MNYQNRWDCGLRPSIEILNNTVFFLFIWASGRRTQFRNAVILNDTRHLIELAQNSIGGDFL
jgi:hypothetical protein